MRTSDHPAAKPRQYRPPVFRADDDEPGTEVTPHSAVADDSSAPAWDDNAPASVDDAAADPQPTREPIATAPQDGTYLRAFWGEDDADGRLVRWRDGRHFNNRRWVTGGTWAPVDGMLPLPAAAPTDWLKPPEEPEGESVEAEEEAA